MSAVAQPRNRLSTSGLEVLTTSLIGLAEQFQPIGVRGLFYRAVVAGVVEKAERSYDQVQRVCKQARLDGRMPWDWIVDASRDCHAVSAFDDIGDLLKAAEQSFRLDLWAAQPAFVQVWVEKEGLAALFAQVTRPFRVPLYPGKGYTSLSFSRQGALQAAEALEAGKRVVVLQWGDYDPSGVNIGESLVEHYRLHGAGEAEVVRVGLKPAHIELWNLPTRPTKRSDTRSRKFGDDRSVELDAVDPGQLKAWVEAEIRQRIDEDLWQASLAEEARQKQELGCVIQGRPTR